VVKLNLFTTTTTISTAEITQVLNKGQQLLADMQLNAAYSQLYHMDDPGYCTRLQLYLMLYAIQSWDISPNALNYFDQNHLILLMSKVEQLFYIMQVKPSC
jgi:hypothetical protein